MNCLCRGLYYDVAVILWTDASAATCWFYMAAGTFEARQWKWMKPHEVNTVLFTYLRSTVYILWSNGLNETHKTRVRRIAIER